MHTSHSLNTTRKYLVNTTILLFKEVKIKNWWFISTASFRSRFRGTTASSPATDTTFRPSTVTCLWARSHVWWTLWTWSTITDNVAFNATFSFFTILSFWTCSYTFIILTGLARFFAVLIFGAFWSTCSILTCLAIWTLIIIGAFGPTCSILTC